MNLTELITRVRRNMGEAGTAMFTDAIITTQLNQSARSLAAQYALLRQRTTLTVVEGGVQTDASIVAIRRLWHNSGRYDLRPTTGGQAPMPGEYTGGGRPDYFTFDNTYGPNLLAVYPSTGTHILTADVLSSGQPMVAGTDVPWDGSYPEHHHVISWHAAHHLNGQRGLTGAAQMAYLARYQQVMDEFRGAVAMQMMDTVPAAPHRNVHRRRSLT